MTREHIRRRKIAYLWHLQTGRCAITGQDLDRFHVQDRWYAQLHRCIHNTVPNRARFPLFIHSVWNLRLVHAGEHGTFPTPKGIPHRVAAKVEIHLQENPEISALVNMETDAEINVEEVAALFDDLLDEVWPERQTA